MQRIYLSADSAVMFIRCKSKSDVICEISNIFAQKTSIRNDNDFRMHCVVSSREFYLNIGNMTDYYMNSKAITYEDFFQHKKKFVFITVEFSSEDMMNLQYVLVLNEYFKKYDIVFYLILKIKNEDNIYYKLAHFFSMQYPINSNVYLKEDDSIYKLPSNSLKHSPGEILPFFYINDEFYRSCFQSFTLDEDVFENINKNKDNAINILKNKYPHYSHTHINLLNCIYAYILRKSLQSNQICNFLDSHIETPIFAIILFVAILSKYNYKEYEYNVVYENCLDYALSLEQLIENAYFYSGNGVLSIRIHRNNSKAMSSVYSDAKFNKYSMEISLIDFQPDNTIVQNFIALADTEENEKEKIRKELNGSSALEHLFYPKEDSALYRYFNKSNVIIQHYGLQTISSLAKKTNALLCIKNGKDFYANNSDMFIYQTSNQYKYMSGVYYRIIIPIDSTAEQFIYTGLNNNQYDYSISKIEHNYVDYSSSLITVPKDRDDKLKSIGNLKEYLFKNYQPNKVMVIKTNKITGRLELEFLIKAIFSLFSEIQSSQQSICIALTELKNKALIKIALRFIALCYNYKGINHNLANKEIFICNKDCDIQILISGENYTDIIKNLYEQRVFGTIDDDIFDELNYTLSHISGGKTL